MRACEGASRKQARTQAKLTKCEEMRQELSWGLPTMPGFPGFPGFRMGLYQSHWPSRAYTFGFNACES